MHMIEMTIPSFPCRGLTSCKQIPSTSAEMPWESLYLSSCFAGGILVQMVCSITTCFDLLRRSRSRPLLSETCFTLVASCNRFDFGSKLCDTAGRRLFWDWCWLVQFNVIDQRTTICCHKRSLSVFKGRHVGNSDLWKPVSIQQIVTFLPWTLPPRAVRPDTLYWQSIW